jgi:hypothetical protein
MALSDYDDLILFLLTFGLIFLMAKYMKPSSAVKRRSPQPNPDIKVDDKGMSDGRSLSVSKSTEERKKHLLVIETEQSRHWPYYVTQSVKFFDNEIHTTGHRNFDWQAFSPLKYYGYTVGKSKGLRFDQRQLVMIITFYADLPDIFPAEYCDRWGNAGTFRRYKKIAEHIDMLYEKNYLVSKMKYAVADWKQDHEWFLSQYSKLANARKACGL